MRLKVVCGELMGEAGGEEVGLAGHGAGLVDQRRHAGEAGAEHEGDTAVAAHADGDIGAASLEDGPGLDGGSGQGQGHGGLAPTLAGELHHVVEVELVAGRGDQLALEAVRRAHEVDRRVGPRPEQRLGQGEPRVDVPTGPARGDDDRRRCECHRRSSLARRF
jgi:hypothetical protein